MSIRSKSGMLIFGLFVAVLIQMAGCSGSGVTAGDQSRVPGYPIADRVFTTRQQTVVPVPLPSPTPSIFPCEVAKYESLGFGKYQLGPGMDEGKRFDIMPAGYNAAGVSQAASLLSFFAISDIHITDKESPAQVLVAGYQGGNSSAYSPVILYTTHVLDAAVQTINALHRSTPFDFGLSLGDAVNNCQSVELKWYLDVLDGKVIVPSTGAHVGSNLDYQAPYQAAGLDKSIPWFQVFGNHDHFWSGAFPVTEALRKVYEGGTLLNLDLAAVPPYSSHGTYVGVIDGRTPYGEVIGAGPEAHYPVPPRVVPDRARRPLSRTEWISEFFKTSTAPAGHGFAQANLDTGLACYSFEPKPTLPLEVLVLDNTGNDDSLSGAVAYLDQARYDWLVGELDRGQAEGKLMIIAAHAPIGLGASGWDPASPISEDALITKLHTYPNLVMWMAGHLHANTIKALPSQDPARPELGFWMVETASLRDYPQQFRTFEIARNSDGTLSIVVTNVDPAVREGTPAARSRSYAIAAQQLFGTQVDGLPTGVFNAELVKQLTPEMTAKIAGLAQGR